MVSKFKYLFILPILFLAFVRVHSQAPDFTGLSVMINPGHGGHDSDDRGMPNGFWESESNLTKGLWLRDLLEARGCEVIMSRVLNRTEDDLELSVIAAMANQNNVDLFISIHSNGGNQVSNYPLTIFNGKSEDPAIPEAKTWARILWEQLISNQATYWTDTNPHHIGDLTLNPGWTYGYGVLYPLQVPGIISEGSFHDYRPEMDRLLSTRYRQQEAWNMMYAMESYFDLAGVEPFGNISGIIRDSLLAKEHYSIANSPDKFNNVNGTLVELKETGALYRVDSLNTGFYMFDSIAPGNYHLVFSATDYFNDTVQVEVLPHQFTYHNHWMRADKTMPPKILFSIPEEGDTINAFDPVRITFNMNMDSASVAEAFTISPETSGTFYWDKYHLNMYFQPDIPYHTNTEYTVTLNNTAEHQWEVPLDSTFSFSFITGDRNRYALEKSFPAADQAEVSPFLQFRLYFDAPLNNTSLIDAVEIIPSEGNPMGTKGATITAVEGKGHYYFSPSEELEYNTDYTLKLYGSIRDEENIPLVDVVEIPFTTMEEPENIVVIDEFDENRGWEIDLQNSAGIDGSSFLYRWTKTYRSGEASTLLRYHFLSANATCIIQPAGDPVSLIENSNMIALWIWGEMSNNILYAGFDDGSETELCTIDFAGWNYCKAALPENASAVTYIKISRGENGAEGGDINLDALNQKDLTSVRDRLTDRIELAYPNPVYGNQLTLENTPMQQTRYRIFNPAGQLLQQGILGTGERDIKLSPAVKAQTSFILQVHFNEIPKSQLFFNTQN